MPTYEYRCPEGHDFELFQRMSDEPVAECPTCGRRAERLLSAGAGFLFKGEGFYITDYRPESYRKEASAERKGEGSSGASGESPAPPDASPKKKSDGGSAGGGAAAAEKPGGSAPSGPTKAD
jgi:putative FmdB family regulatory protein